MHKHTCKVEKCIGPLFPPSKGQYKFVFYTAFYLFGNSYFKLFIQDVTVLVFFPSMTPIFFNLYYCRFTSYI